MVVLKNLSYKITVVPLLTCILFLNTPSIFGEDFDIDPYLEAVQAVNEAQTLDMEGKTVKADRLRAEAKKKLDSKINTTAKFNIPSNCYFSYRGLMGGAELHCDIADGTGSVILEVKVPKAQLEKFQDCTRCTGSFVFDPNAQKLVYQIQPFLGATLFIRFLNFAALPESKEEKSERAPSVPEIPSAPSIPGMGR